MADYRSPKCSNILSTTFSNRKFIHVVTSFESFFVPCMTQNHDYQPIMKLTVVRLFVNPLSYSVHLP